MKGIDGESPQNLPAAPNNSDWPFDAWLKLAVRGYRLTPAAFWEMSLCDWLCLTKANAPDALSRDDLAALIQSYPDESQDEPNR